MWLVYFYADVLTWVVTTRNEGFMRSVQAPVIVPQWIYIYLFYVEH